MTDAVKAFLQGFHVFPVEPGAKTPIRMYQDRPEEEAPWTVKWSEIATNDINTIIEWWTYAPNANVGIACKPSGIFVVDCDRAKADGQLSGTPFNYLHDLFGPRVDGETVFDQVAQRYGGTGSITEVFDTYTVTTGSGGKHFYYRWPPEVHSTQDSIVKGVLDVRGNGGERGGYVLGAGSRTTQGGYAVCQSFGIRPAPPWLVELCKDRPRYREPVVRQNRTPSSFTGLIQTVRDAPDGNLNNAFFWAARAMCNDGGTEELANELLGTAYVECNGRGGERQARSTIRSAYRLQGGS